MGMRIRISAAVILCYASMTNCASAEMESASVQNKQIAIDFFTLALLEHKVAQAFDLYVGDTYIQHNPNVEDGPEKARAFMESLAVNNPGVKGEIVRTIAEDNLVALHLRWRWLEGGVEKQAAGIDIFRIEAGKVVEHWDVNQMVPMKSANTNTMF